MPSHAAAPLAQLAEQLTINQLPNGVNLEESAHSNDCAAPRAAVSPEHDYLNAELREITGCWPNLPEAIRDRGSSYGASF